MEECVIKYKDNFYLKTEVGYKKIILTTDQDLIKDGVQAIDDEFLEWFVQNPSCESVEVEEEDYSQKCRECGETVKRGYSCKKGCFMKSGNFIPTDENIKYKIIIPKEEPKQGTMSEAIKQVLNNKLKKETLDQKLENIVSKDPSKFWEESDERVNKKETLNEVAHQFAEEHREVYQKSNYASMHFGFYWGANWQQERMYSEEEVIELLEKRDKYLGNWLPPKKWLEQFKKEIR